MQDFFSRMAIGVNIVDVIDILIVAFIIYIVLVFIRSTRAEQLVKGLLILVGITILSDRLNLYTLSWILKGAMTLGVVALVIVFQPEVRRGLEYLGRSKLAVSAIAQLDKGKAKQLINEFVRAIEFLSKERTGALIVLERRTALSDICESGTQLNAEISAELLINIFHPATPLHDGAVIIRGDRILAAGCVLPLTKSRALSKDLGTRHRAGMGITEHSDAVVLIVSEESGVMSMATNGEISRFLDSKTVEKTLLNFYLEGSEMSDKLPWFSKIRNRRRRKKDAKK